MITIKNCPAISQVSREVSSKYDMGMICEYEYELPSYFSQIKKGLSGKDLFWGLLIQLSVTCWEKIWKSVHCQGFSLTMIMKYDIAEKLAKLSLTGCCLKRNVNWQAIRD